MGLIEKFLHHLKTPRWGVHPDDHKRPAADAPLRNPFPEGRSLHFEPGETVPYSAQCIEDTEHARREWNATATDGELTALKRDNVILSKPLFWGLIGGTAVVAVLSGIAIGVAASQAKR